jgi:hypothetical protein
MLKYGSTFGLTPVGRLSVRHGTAAGAEQCDGLLGS